MTWWHPRASADGNARRRCKCYPSRGSQRNMCRSCTFSFSNFRPLMLFPYKFQYQFGRPFVATQGRLQ